MQATNQTHQFHNTMEQTINPSLGKDNHNPAKTLEEEPQQRTTQAALTLAEYGNKEKNILDNFSTLWNLDRLIETFSEEDKTTLKRGVLCVAMASTNNQHSHTFLRHFDTEAFPNQTQDFQALLKYNSKADDELESGAESMPIHPDEHTETSINNLLESLNSFTQLDDKNAAALRGSIITTINAIKHRTDTDGNPTPPSWNNGVLMPDLMDDKSTADAISSICEIDKTKVLSILSDLNGTGYEENSFTKAIIENSPHHAFPNFRDDDDAFDEIIYNLFVREKGEVPKPTAKTNRATLYFTILITQSYHPPLNDKEEAQKENLDTLKEHFNTLVQHEFNYDDLEKVLKCLDILQQMSTEKNNPLSYADYIETCNKKSDSYLIDFHEEFKQQSQEKQAGSKSNTPLEYTPLEYFTKTRIFNVKYITGKNELLT